MNFYFSSVVLYCISCLLYSRIIEHSFESNLRRVDTSLQEHSSICIFNFAGFFTFKIIGAVSSLYSTILPDERTGVLERNIRGPYFGHYFSAIWQRYVAHFLYIGGEKPFKVWWNWVIARAVSTWWQQSFCNVQSSVKIRKDVICWR